jgi:stage III sporulation protein AB
MGSLMIIAASTGAGMLIASRFRARPKEIRQWMSALQSIEAEIVYGRVPVAELAEHLAGQLPDPVGSYFSSLRKNLQEAGLSLRESWTKALEEYWLDTALKKSEKEILLQFGTTLGNEDADNQQKHIHLALAHLRRQESEARAAQSANEKMARSLGFLSGLLLALMFI